MAQFVSFVGTQVMGTLNPILGVMNTKEKPKSVLLLHTNQTEKQAETIKTWLIQRFDNIEIKKQYVSTAFNINEVPISRNEDIYFNLSGGMNYQVASFVWQYIKNEGESHLKFVYSERESIWLFDIKKHNYQPLSPVIRLEAEEVLNIQGVPFERIKCNETVLELLRRIGIKSPLSLKLGNIEFDNIFTTENFITLVKFIVKGYNLDKIRRVIAFCGKNRQELKELHSFEVLIFTDDKRIQERFLSETVGEVRVIYFNDEDRLNPHCLLKNKKDSIIGSHLQKELIYSETIKPPMCGATLYVVMSPELTNTMISIYTHKFSNLCLIYTPGDRRVKRFINKIRNEKITLPHCGGLQLTKTDITGFNLLKMEKFGDGEQIVNITPGPKSHAGMLTLWGIQNNAKICSINNLNNTIDSLDGSDKIEIKNPPLHLLLSLKDEIKNPGKQLGYKRIKYFYSIIAQFKELKKRDYNNNNFTEEEFEEEIKKILGEKYNQGHFFEILTAFAFEKIGCSEILIGVKTGWSEESKKCISEIHQSKSFKSEIDVVCVFEKKYLVISTKMSQLGTKVQLINEIKAQSEILGRMSIPILVILKHQYPPEINYNGVTVIGWKTLFDEEELRETIRKTIQAKMTTKQE